MQIDECIYYFCKKGKFSPLVGYDHYKKLHNEINNSLVGLTTTNGIEITGQSDHFIERVIGVIKDPDTGKKRLGVELQDIQDALTNGKAMKPKLAGIKTVTFYMMKMVNLKYLSYLLQINVQYP